MVKIVKGTGDSVQIGSSDYPLNIFRAHYLSDSVRLIPINTQIISAARLEFKYADLVDGDDAPIGDGDAVRAYLQANIYSAPVAPEVE